MANIRKEITTCYSAERVGEEDYNLLEERSVCTHEISYDAQGLRNVERYIYEDSECTESSSILYKDGLPDCKWSEGWKIGTYSHKTISDNVKVESYVGEDGHYTREYYNDLRVYERNEYDGKADIFGYEYDDEGRIVRKKIVHDDINDGPTFEIADYIYQDGMSTKEIFYRCESPSIDDFFEGNYTKCDDVEESEKTDSFEETGNFGIHTVRVRDLQDNRVFLKTISVYDIPSDNIIRKTHITFGQSTEAVVEETIYKY